jgi:hypothetical protein
MIGATEYARIFKTGQHGKIFIISGSHARGETFHIWILPSDEPIKGMPWTVKNAVEVYGITGGQPGWTETYGWLYKGKWQQDFAELLEKRKHEIEQAKAELELARLEKEKAATERKNDLLAAY